MPHRSTTVHQLVITHLGPLDDADKHTITRVLQGAEARIERKLERKEGRVESREVFRVHDGPCTEAEFERAVIHPEAASKLLNTVYDTLCSVHHDHECVCVGCRAKQELIEGLAALSDEELDDLDPRRPDRCTARLGDTMPDVKIVGTPPRCDLPSKHVGINHQAESADGQITEWDDVNGTVRMTRDTRRRAFKDLPFTDEPDPKPVDPTSLGIELSQKVTEVFTDAGRKLMDAIRNGGPHQ